MRVTGLLTVVLLGVLQALAQGGVCSEDVIKSQIGKDDPSIAAEDAFFFSGALDEPVIGTAAADKAFKPVAANRKNEQYDPGHPDRIVVTPSGDMAYEYGTEHMSFDQRDTGEHRDFTAAYLRVWKNVDGKCKIAAAMFEPERKAQKQAAQK
jgi:ketosteroid isomerase-like protein